MILNLIKGLVVLYSNILCWRLNSTTLVLQPEPQMSKPPNSKNLSLPSFKKNIKHPWNVFMMNHGLQIFRVTGDIMIDEEIYLHVWECYTAQSIHLENIFKRLRNWAHLHSSFSLVLVSTLFPLFAHSQLLLQPCEKRDDRGFFHHGILRRVLEKNWVIHHHLFKLRFCSLGFRPGIPAASVTISPHCLKSLKRISHCFRTWAVILHCTSFLCLHLAYDPCVPFVFLLHSYLGSERNKFQDYSRITYSQKIY